jgi:YD repeat-containing protein
MPDGSRSFILQGLLGSIIDRNGNRISFEYDAYLRPIRIVDPLKREVNFAYNINLLCHGPLMRFSGSCTRLDQGHGSHKEISPI